MSGQLESALVISLRESIRWESALRETSDGTVVSETGTLTTVGASDPFDPLAFQARDRQLAYRDLILAAAIVDTSVQIGDVWNFPAIRPLMEGPAERQLPAVNTGEITSSGTASLVRHVDHSWVPYDAAQYTDRDLYGRDALAYEVLARACESIFTDPPIARIDASGTNLPDTSVWSLGQGTFAPKDISPSLPLNRELFRDPDLNLADRDNQLAGYVARVAQVLKNPFAYANRLYMRVSGVDARETELYVLVTEDASSRTWSAEPRLSGRNQIVYDKLSKTLTWTREHADELHVPQLYALSIPGIEIGQTLDTVPAVPERKDAQFWRAKAATVVPTGGSLSDEIVMGFTATDDVTGGQPQVTCASFTVPGKMEITLPGDVAGGQYRVAVLAVPNPVVEVPGIQNISATAGTEGGATYEVDVASGDIDERAYYVEGGSGIVYDGDVYYPGQTFHGNGVVTTYTQYSASNPSTVRQYLVNWQLALPPGSWGLQIEFTNLSGSADGFGLVATFKPAGANAVEIIKDTAPQLFSGDNGDLELTPPGLFDAPNGQPFTLSLLWTYGTGQLHIRRLIFTNTTIPTCRISVDGTLNSGEASVEVTGKAYQPETLLFDVTAGAASPAIFEMRLNGDIGTDDLLPIQVKQVTVQTVGTYHGTPNAAAFQGWRQECLDRTERLLEQAYGEIVTSYGTEFPTFYSSGTAWDWRNTEDWMALLETRQPRLREMLDVPSGSLSLGRQYVVSSGAITYDTAVYNAGDTFYASSTATYTGVGQVDQVGAFQKSNPGHIGKPALVPFSLEFSGSTATLAFSGSFATPQIAACQPWMIDLGLYTAQEDFWMPASL